MQRGFWLSEFQNSDNTVNRQKYNIVYNVWTHPSKQTFRTFRIQIWKTKTVKLYVCKCCSSEDSWPSKGENLKDLIVCIVIDIDGHKLIKCNKIIHSNVYFVYFLYIWLEKKTPRWTGEWKSAQISVRVCMCYLS